MTPPGSGKLHYVAAFAQEGWNVEIVLLKIRVLEVRVLEIRDAAVHRVYRYGLIGVRTKG